eukprot:TRINITY_DN17323_c0_g2_i1.p1 TRINITY_DN17323_c0_g2~~TRINITY_DN17323_c0_g2_i1.p1  ORF type:complete len:244 (-),score=7.92 TRINITY_DN17323_c0_g2_i1:76-807(-)
MSPEESIEAVAGAPPVARGRGADEVSAKASALFPVSAFHSRGTGRGIALPSEAFRASARGDVADSHVKAGERLLDDGDEGRTSQAGVGSGLRLPSEREEAVFDPFESPKVVTRDITRLEPSREPYVSMSTSDEPSSVADASPESPTLLGHAGGRTVSSAKATVPSGNKVASAGREGNSGLQSHDRAGVQWGPWDAAMVLWQQWVARLQEEVQEAWREAVVLEMCSREREREAERERWVKVAAF